MNADRSPLPHEGGYLVTAKLLDILTEIARLDLGDVELDARLEPLVPELLDANFHIIKEVGPALQVLAPLPFLRGVLRSLRPKFSLSNLSDQQWSDLERIHRIEAYDKRQSSIEQFSADIMAGFDGDERERPLPHQLSLALEKLRPCDGEIYAARLRMCLSCEFGGSMPRSEVKAKEFIRCKKCGCIMNLKARIKASKCPIGRF